MANFRSNQREDSIRGAWIISGWVSNLLATLLLVSLISCLPAAAATPAAKSGVAIVLSQDSAEYQSIAEKIRQGLRDSRHYDKTVHLLIADQIKEKNSQKRLTQNIAVVVTIGVKALKGVLATPGDAPLFAVFVPRLSYEKILQQTQSDNSPAASRPISALFLDQPVERQLRLAKRLSPDFKKVGLLLGIKTSLLDKKLKRLAARLDIDLIAIRAQNSRKIVPALNRVNNGIDILLTVFDPDIISRNSAKQILYYSYNHYLPVIGYSKAMVKAGALAAVYSDTGQIGRQAAEQLIEALDSTPVALPEAGYPVYYQAICNQSLVRYFHIRLECNLADFSQSGESQ